MQTGSEQWQPWKDLYWCDQSPNCSVIGAGENQKCAGKSGDGTKTEKGGDVMQGKRQFSWSGVMRILATSHCTDCCISGLVTSCSVVRGEFGNRKQWKWWETWLTISHSWAAARSTVCGVRSFLGQQMLRLLSPVLICSRSGLFWLAWFAEPNRRYK